MPIVEVPSDPGFRGDLGQTPPPPTDYSGLFPAAFRQANSVVSLLSDQHSLAFPPEPGYSPLADIRGSKYFDNYADRFAGSNSLPETQSIKTQIDQEEADRATLNAAGGIGVAAQMLAGTVDPTMLLPGGAGAKVLEEGYAFGRAARVVGRAAAIGTTVQEAALQASQETRPFSESALNIGSATILSALIGEGAAAMLSPVERVGLVKGLDHERAAMDAHASGAPAPGPYSATIAPADFTKKPLGPAFVEPTGKPGFNVETARNFDPSSPAGNKQVVFRDESGLPKAIADFTSSPMVYVDPALRRQGIATKMYDFAAQNGIDVGASGTGELTSEGAAFVNSRVSRGVPLAQAAGAAAADTRQLALPGFGLDKIPGISTLIKKMSPMQTLFRSDSLTARRAAADLSETALLTGENLRGETTTLAGGPAVDAEARLLTNQARVAVGDELNKQFTEYRFNGEPPMLGPRAGSFIQDVTGRADGKMSFADFKAEVTKAGQQGNVHEIPQVQAAAQFIRQKVFNVWGPRAEKAIDGFQQMTSAPGESYMHRVWNKQAVAAKRNEVANLFTEHYAMDQHAKATAKDRIAGLNDSVRASEDRIANLQAKADRLPELDKARSDLEYEISLERSRQDGPRQKIEDEIAAWEGKSTIEAKSAIKAREAYTAEKLAAGKSPGAEGRLTGADAAVDRAVQRIIASDRNLSRDELRSIADQTVDRILSSPDGRLPYDIAHSDGIGFSAGGEAPRGPLAGREFHIPDATVRPFLEHDVEHVLHTYLRTMVPDVLITERFGDTRMTEAFRKINEEFAALSANTKSEAKSTAIEKQRQNAIGVLAAMRDRVRGTYGFSSELPMRNARRVSAALKNFNVPVSMGMATLSSLPDAAGAVFRHGMLTAFRDAWVPYWKGLMRLSDAYPEAKRQFRAMGIAIESDFAQRQHTLTDTMDSYRPQSRLERTLQWSSDKFMMANLLAPWTDAQKVMASMVAGSEILRAVDAAAAGKATARQLRTLGESNIKPELYPRIAKSFSASGEVRDGVHLPNTADWTDAEARRVFEGAVARDANIAVVTPGQEKPLWMSHPVYSIFGQFQSFTAGAQERILIANLQRRDAQVMQGLVTSLGLGMLSYKLNALTGGQPTSDKPGDWIKESISRANLVGWFEWGNALSSKVSGGAVDVYRLLGAPHPMSRYASRSALDQLLGPTAGKIEDLLKITSAVGRRDWNASDSHSLRRLTFMQNLFYLRRGFDAVEAGANNAFGIQAPTKH